MLTAQKDHPRIRGEHSPVEPSYSKHEGSSPHTRGALLQYIPAVGLCRIIPAYAGSTSRTRPGLPRRTDHPRIRGEHKNCATRWAAPEGSSPHTRGALRDRAIRRHPPRIIPAYAGSTRHSFCHRYPAWDHPRIRGEHCADSLNGDSFCGSSPHTRGAHLRRQKDSTAPRIIPAYAGSTSPNVRRHDSRQDHPRIRGEHGWVSCVSCTLAGSSPHTRGAPFLRRTVLEVVRIIPAYAGSTVPEEHGEIGRQDHPRIRGEHGEVFRVSKTPVGSSPHTRGAHVQGDGHHGEERIIPAYAGSTATWTAASISRTDHPRIRGEHRADRFDGDSLGGSSPHTRGARSPAAVRRWLSGIIPAYAGSTDPCPLADWATVGSSPHTRGAPTATA